MDFNNILYNFKFKRSKYDDIDKSYIENLDINSIFKAEGDIISEYYNLDENSKNLDLIYFQYNQLKHRINTIIEEKKNLLINIQKRKEEFNKEEIRRKIVYLSKEYSFYKEQTDTKQMMSKIENLQKKIDFLKNDLEVKDLDLQREKIKEKYKHILAFIHGEKFDNKQENFSNIYNNDEKIQWYEKRIQECVEKQMVFNNYMFLLENYYHDILNKKILDSTHSKETV